MNKTFFLAIMVALVAILSTSCTNYRSAGPGVTKTVTTDTTITDHLPLLGDRFDCNGNKLSQSKVTGWMIDRQRIARSSECAFTWTEVWEEGYVYYNRSLLLNWLFGPDFNAPRAWDWILLLLLILFIAWVLYTLLKNKNTNQSTNNPPAPTAPPVTPPTAVKNQANLMTVNDVSEMMKTLGKNGGSLETRPDGSFSANFNPAKDENKQTMNPASPLVKESTKDSDTDLKDQAERA